jgi:hypothetical protein
MDSATTIPERDGMLDCGHAGMCCIPVVLGLIDADLVKKQRSKSFAKQGITYAIPPDRRPFNDYRLNFDRSDRAKRNPMQ